jgi:hypothetical protein
LLLERGKLLGEGLSTFGVETGSDSEDEDNRGPSTAETEIVDEINVFFVEEDTSFTGGLLTAELAIFVEVGIFAAEVGISVECKADEEAAPRV